MDNPHIYNGLWASIMKDKYIKNNFFRIPKKLDGSTVWKEIINHRKYIRVGIGWYIRDVEKSNSRRMIGFI